MKILNLKNVYVILSEDKAKFITNNKSWEVEFDDRIFYNSAEFYSAVISQNLNTENLTDVNLYLVLSEHFYKYRDTVKILVKGSKSITKADKQYYCPISYYDSINQDTIQNTISYEYDSKCVADFDLIPEGVNYCRHNRLIQWESAVLESFVSSLRNYNIDVCGFMALPIFANSISGNVKSAFLSMYKKTSFLTVFEGDRISKIIEFSLCSNDFISEMSNKYGISHYYSELMFDNYACAFVPQKYIEKKILVPVFENVNKRIPLCDMAYGIRARLSSFCRSVANEFSGVSQMSLYDFSILGSDVLFKMSFGCECIRLNEFLHSFADMQVEKFNSLIPDSSVNEEFVAVEEEKKEEKKEEKVYEEEQIQTPTDSEVESELNQMKNEDVFAVQNPQRSWLETIVGTCRNLVERIPVLMAE